ncbi:RecA-superfamily ATPase implicated in signal transduction [Candidatus Nanohalococcus occultus]|uniref:RecA-superfamily ATPase implicated in signal transduction n=1 Tax=Candidatus Nanohalococcus occultus TaxID=2978047 RepID=A0ABY8CJA6_9ARCH|nr:RecA-superfamily ATPase implicated in signal transduction [Candidatus Nanohaloarchaeota archaeon SVXNc]
MERVDSGIKNFDRLLGGGIPKGMTVLVEGEPGSGKSNLGLEYLYRGALKGENGLYISFQDTENEVLRTTTFDWKFKDKVENGEINIEKFDPYRYEKLANMLRNALMENNAERVVLDPVTDLDLYIDTRKDQRKNLLEIKNELKELGCTTLLLAEQEESTELEEEIADGIIQMSLTRDEEGMKRQIYVKKLKGTDFNHSVHRYIFKNDGLKIK